MQQTEASQSDMHNKRALFCYKNLSFDNWDIQQLIPEPIGTWFMVVVM